MRDEMPASLGLAGGLSGTYLHPTHQPQSTAQPAWVDDRDGRPRARLSRPAISGIGKQSALRIWGEPNTSDHV